MIKSALWAYFNKIIVVLEEQFPERTHVVRYGRFADSTRETLEDVCDFLGVEFQEEMMSRSYEPNSSFRSQAGDRERSQELSSVELYVGWGVAEIVRALPLSILDRIYGYLRTHPSNKPLPSWYFRIRDQRQADKK